MESNYDKIKKMFANEDNSLPPELQWENMEEGIMEKMASMKSAESGKKSRRNIYIVTATIVILAMIQFLCSPFGKSGYAEDARDEQLFKSSEGDRDIDSHTIKEPNSVEETGNVLNEDRSDLQEAAMHAKGQADSEFGKGRSESGNNTGTLTKDTSGTRTRSSFAESGDEDLTVEEMPITTDRHPIENGELPDEQFEGSSNLTGFKNTIPLTNKADLTFEPIDRLSRDIPLVSHTLSVLFLNMTRSTHFESEIDPVRAIRRSGRLSLNSGISWWTYGYGEVKPERHNYETNLESFNLQLQYTHALPGGFRALIGLQYMQLESRFDIEREIENYTVVLQDTILEVQANYFTGGQEFVRGDIEVPVGARRVIRHYNQTRLYQIPVAIGRSWTSINWEGEVFAGAALNFASTNNGRTLFQGEVYDYTGSEAAFVSNQWKIKGLLSARLTYWVNEHIGASFNVQMQKSLMNWSTEENIHMRPMMYSLSFGLEYGF